MTFLSASPVPWKKSRESPKSAIKIETRLSTTADVVDSPTPLAPPVVVNPHAQLMVEIMPPKTNDLITELMMSQEVRARAAESRITFPATSYAVSARKVAANGWKAERGSRGMRRGEMPVRRRPSPTAGYTHLPPGRRSGK